MNKITLPLVALSAITAPVQMQAAEMTAEQKKAAIEEMRNTLSRVINDLNSKNSDDSFKYHEQVKTQYLTRASYLMAEVNKLTVENTDVVISSYKSLVDNLSTEIGTAEEPYVVYDNIDTNLKKLEDLLKAGIDALDNYPNVKEKYEKLYDEVGVFVSVLRKQVDGYDLTKQDIVLAKTEIESSINNMLGTVEGYNKGIDNANALAGKSAESYEANETKIKEFETEYYAQLKAAVSALPTEVYKDWQEKAIEELNEQNRIVQAIKKDDAAYMADPENKTCEDKTAEIGKALVMVQNIVNNYVAKKNDQETAKQTADTAVNEKQTTLNTMKEALKVREITSCNDDIDAVQVLIDALNGTIVGNYKAHTVDKLILDGENYTGKLTEIQIAINNVDDSKSDDKGHKYQPVLDNYDAYKAVLDAAKAAQTALNDAKIQADKQSEDKAYTVVSKYAKTIGEIQDAIDKVKADAESAYKAFNAEKLKSELSNNASTQETAAKDLKTTATDLLKKYNEVAKKISDTQEALNDLSETATDKEVTLNGEVGGKTYETFIKDTQDAINALQKKLNDANGKLDNDHKTALNAIVATIEGADEIKTNKDNYAGNKKDFDEKTAVAAAKNCIDNATERMNALETVINSIDVTEETVGNQSTALTTNKDALVDELRKAGVGNKIADMQKLFEENEKDNASKVVAEYTKINTALAEMEEKAAELAEKAKDAAENFEAYTATKKLYTDGGNSDVEKALKALNDKIDNKATGDAKTYYTNELKKLQNKLAADGDIYKAIEKSYADKTSVADKDEHVASIADVKATAEKLTGAIESNQRYHEDQISDLQNLNGTWQTIYNTISADDQSTKAKEYLARLAKELEKINALDKKISEAFAQGKSEEKNDEITQTYKEISEAITKIATDQKTGYSEQITEDNTANHDLFVEKYNAAYKEFGTAVETLDKFCSIKNGALAVATEKYIATHDSIYAYAEKLRTLKAEEQADYDKYATSPEDDVYDVTKHVETANKYKSDIAGKLKEYCDAVNNAAHDIFDPTYTKVKNAVETNEAKVNKFTYGKDNAFNDVKEILDAADKLKDDQNYALQVDTWLESLKDYENKLAADLANAYNKEKNGWLTAIEELYNKEMADIEALTGIDKNDYLKELKTHYDDTYGKAKKLDKNIDASKEEGQETIGNIVANCKKYLNGAAGSDNKVTNSKVYQDAKKASDDAIANDKIYNDILDMIDDAANNVADAKAWVSEMYVNQNSAVVSKLQAIDKQLEALRDGAEANKGKSAEYEQTAENAVENIKTAITDLKKLAIKNSLDTDGCLKERIDAVKEEYNKLAASGPKGLEEAKLYDQVIAGYYKELNEDTKDDKGNVTAQCLTNKYAQNTLTDDKNIEAAKKALVDFEKKVAGTYMDINKKFTNTQVADAKTAVDNAIKEVEGKIAEAKTWADYNDATGMIGDAIVADLTAELDAIKEDVAAKGDDVLFYKNNIISATGALSKAVDDNCSSLKAEYDKQKTNDEVYAAIVKTTDDLKATLTDSYDKIKDLDFVKAKKDVDVTVKGEDDKETTKKVNPFDKAYNYDIAADIEKIKAAAEAAHKNVSLKKDDDKNLKVGENTVKTAAEAVEKAIADKETEAKNGEAQAKLADLEKVLQTNGDIDEAINNNNYSPTKEAELTKTLTKLKEQVKAAQDYNTDAQDGEISKDIDGNKIKDKDGKDTTEKVDYNTKAWEALQARIAELNTAVEKLKSDIEGYAYIVGDADHDGIVTVNDYTYVRELILTATKYENIEDEAIRFGADANNDKAINIGDLSAISNIIFYGNAEGETNTAPSKARARVAVAVDDEITITKESEETSVFGKTVRMAVNLTHSEAFAGGQFDITLPAGLKIAGKSLSDRANGHEAYINEIGDNTYRVLVATIDNKEFNGLSGAIVYLDVEVSSSFNGNADINISNAIFTKTSGACFSIGNGGNGGNGTTGIDGIEAATVKERVYSIGGQIRKAVSKGINIIVGEDGQSKKVIKK